jgi:hypothetical protein
MENSNPTAGQQELPQPLLEALHKLIHAGASPEMISSVLGLKYEIVQQLLANDPTQIAALVQSVRERSREFRCVLSNRLMVSPVMAPDGNYYEFSILAAHPSLSSELVMPHPKLKAKIAEFSKESLRALGAHLEHPTEEILALTAECLSVLSFETEMQTVFRVLGAVQGEALHKLIEQLSHLVPEEALIVLMNRAAGDLPSLVLCLARLLMLKPFSGRAFEEAFKCLLSQAAFNAKAIDLSEEISGKLSSSQLGQINQALRAQPREWEIERLDGLRLKEAFLQLKQRNAETAVNLVRALRITPNLEAEALRFYDEAGISSGKVTVLRQRLSAALEAIGRESPPISETLNTLQQLFYAEIETLRSEAATQQALISLKEEVEAISRDLAKTGQQLKQAQTTQDTQLKGVQDQSHRVEGTTQLVLSSLRGEVLTLQRELGEAMNMLQDTREELYQLKVNVDQPTKPQLKYELQAMDVEECNPAFIYSYLKGTDQLHRTNLLTGEESSHQVPPCQFKEACCWNELPGGSLLITGGGRPAVSDAVRIDVRIFAAGLEPPMLSPRRAHAAVLHSQVVYVLGGYSDKRLKECERFVLAESRWEAIPPLPTACNFMSAVGLESSLYALGGLMDATQTWF